MRRIRPTVRPGDLTILPFAPATTARLGHVLRAAPTAANQDPRLEVDGGAYEYYVDMEPDIEDLL